MAIVLEMYEYSDVAFIQDVWMVIYCHRDMPLNI